MRNNLFKAVERRIARELGGQRVGQYGGADVVTDSLAIECKQRKSFPTWLWAAIRQAEKNAGDQQSPVVILHETGNRYEDDLVMMRLSVFKGLVSE